MKLRIILPSGENVMAIQGSSGRPPAKSHETWLCRVWGCVLDFALVLWVIRVPLVMTFLGFLILWLAPQAQDLFVDFAYQSVWYIPLFLLLLFFVWAMPTHYSARLLLDTDARLQHRLGPQSARSTDRLKCPGVI
jgi:hypothetical protein